MTAQLSGGEVKAAAGFTEPFDWDIRQKDGESALELDPADVVHFELAATQGGAAILEFDDQNPSEDGSEIVITTRGNAGTDTPASGQVILHEADTEAYSGKRYYVLWFTDSADDNKKKIIRRGVINFFAR